MIHKCSNDSPQLSAMSRATLDYLPPSNGKKAVKLFRKEENHHHHHNDEGRSYYNSHHHPHPHPRPISSSSGEIRSIKPKTTYGGISSSSNGNGNASHMVFKDLDATNSVFHEDRKPPSTQNHHEDRKPPHPEERKPPSHDDRKPPVAPSSASHDSVLPTTSRNGGVDAPTNLIPQWGHNKRSRGYRPDSRSNLNNNNNNSSSSAHVQEDGRSELSSRKLAASPFVKRVPRPEKASGSSSNNHHLGPFQVPSRTSSLRPVTPHRETSTSGFNPSSSAFSARNQEDHASASGNGVLHHRGNSTHEGRNSHKRSADEIMSSPARRHRERSADKVETAPAPAMNAGVGTSCDGGGVAERMDLDAFEWPKINLSLTRKEKEEDFLAMRGSKLPQRPKKRTKPVERALQYCFPGNWLPEINRSRYEVREKKSTKKKPRGLKAMENLDSDTD